MRLSAGSTLGPYQITGPIGAGGMGEVYRARDTRLGREVAIKILPREVAADAERLARFEREARSSSALNHPNIVTVHDFTSRDGETWLVMELIRGESLRDLLTHGALPLKKLLTIGTGIADGLAAAHAAGIVHRDLKPENVMVTSDGVPKILDFGLVKQLPGADLTDSPTEQQISREGITIGTATYMSPEQARGAPIDFRSDQFSLGLILYEMATGKHPFRRATSFETLTAIANDETPPLNESFPEPFIWIVERCLAKNPAERYGSTADLARDLGHLRERPDRPAAAPRRKLAMTPWLFAAAALAVALIVILVVQSRKPRGFTEPFQTAIATPQIAHVFQDEVAVPIALSPDGHLLVIYGTGANGVSGLWLHDLRSGSQRTLVENAFSAAWSPDGTAIAYFADGKLKTMALEGGPPRVVCDARPEGTPTWEGDTILFAQYSRPGIYRVPAAGGNPERIVQAQLSPPRQVWSPQFLSDGKRFFYLDLYWSAEKGSIEHDLFIGYLDGRPAKKVPITLNSRVDYANGHLLFVRDGTLLAQPFDPDEVRFTGEARPVINDLHYFRSTGNAAFAVSENGVLAWRVARRPTRLVWFDRSGIEQKAVGTAPFHPEGRLSPDGRRFAAAIVDPKLGISDLWIYDLERESVERLSFRLFDERAPVWAPDLQSLYYRSDGGGGAPDIFRWQLGDEDGKLFYRALSLEEPHDVSPDGKWLLFVDHRQAVAADIFLLPLWPPGPPRPFLATPFHETSPRFSPDGRWVAYVSNASGRAEVYVKLLEGSAPATRISKDGGTHPRFASGGGELYFLGPGGRLMVSAGFATPRMLFHVPDAVDFEPAPDGSRFLVQLQPLSAEPPVNILINWPARL